MKCGGIAPKIRTLAQYQDAWIVCRVAEDLLTALDDGSEAALWSSALAHRCFDFEDAYLAEHGHMPLSPAPQDMEGRPGPHNLLCALLIARIASKVPPRNSHHSSVARLH